MLLTQIRTSLSARFGSTTLASGMLTGSLLGCTVLRGMLIGRLVIVSPGAARLFSLSVLLDVVVARTSVALGEEQDCFNPRVGDETAPVSPLKRAVSDQ